MEREEESAAAPRQQPQEPPSIFDELWENQRQLAAVTQRMQRGMRNALALYPHLEGELRALARASMVLLLRLSFESSDAEALAKSCEAFRACLWARRRRKAAAETAAVDCCEHIREDLRGACREVFRLEAAVLAREPEAARLLQRRLVPACCAWGLLVAQHAAFLARLSASLRGGSSAPPPEEEAEGRGADAAVALQAVDQLSKELADEVARIAGLRAGGVRATLRSWARSRWVWYGVALALGAAALYYYYPLHLVAPPPSQVLAEHAAATFGNATFGNATFGNATFGNATGAAARGTQALLSVPRPAPLLPWQASPIATPAAAFAAGGTAALGWQPAGAVERMEARLAAMRGAARSSPAPVPPALFRPRASLLASISAVSEYGRRLVHSLQSLPDGHWWDAPRPLPILPAASAGAGNSSNTSKERASSGREASLSTGFSGVFRPTIRPPIIKEVILSDGSKRKFKLRDATWEPEDPNYPRTEVVKGPPTSHTVHFEDGSEQTIRVRKAIRVPKAAPGV
jgi:hypothetical protein